MALLMASPVLLPSNGHASNSTDEENHVSDNGHALGEYCPNCPHANNGLIQQDPDEHSNHQGTPTGHGKAGAVAEHPSIFSSFKNKIFGTTIPETHAEHNEADGNLNELDTHEDVNREHQEDHQTTPEPNEFVRNGHGGDDRKEHFELHNINLRVSTEEPDDQGDAFPPCFSQSPTHRQLAEDPNSPHINTTNSVNTAIPSLPSTPRLHGQDDVEVNGNRNMVGSQVDLVVSTTSTRASSLQTPALPPPGHHEQCEASPYQLLANHQHVMTEHTEGHKSLGLKDAACQLPECVLSRAHASTSGISAAGGAQMEHLLARVRQERTASRARAWEESAKAKAFNRYSRDESKIIAWENTMKAKAEARMLKAQENLDKERAKHIERMKNAVATAHRTAQERRAAMEARKAEQIVKAEEIASRIRATGKMPRNCLCITA